MQRRLFLLAGPAAAVPARAQPPAPPPELLAEWAAEAPRRPQGEGRMTWFGITLYDIALWAPTPVTAERSSQAALALQIVYRRSLEGVRIADASLQQMRRGGLIEEADATRWLGEMRRLFPDVEPGDRITGVQQPGRGARFHLNGRFAGEVREARFAERFFGIWLAPWTSEPALRQALLGQAS